MVCSVASLKPSYMSVTYGAGGNTRKNTVAIAKGIQDTTGVTTIAHLTLLPSSHLMYYEYFPLLRLHMLNGQSLLRQYPFVDFHYASELVSEIKAYGDFCVGGACYPEGHVEAANKSEDIINLKKKVDVARVIGMIPGITGTLMPCSLTRYKKLKKILLSKNICVVKNSHPASIFLDAVCRSAF